MNYLIKTGVFSPVCNYLRPSNNSRQLIFNINAVVLALLSPYPCFISLLYLDLYVLGDDALIS